MKLGHHANYYTSVSEEAGQFKWSSGWLFDSHQGAEWKYIDDITSVFCLALLYPEESWDVGMVPAVDRRVMVNIMVREGACKMRALPLARCKEQERLGSILRASRRGRISQGALRIEQPNGGRMISEVFRGCGFYRAWSLN